MGFLNCGMGLRGHKSFYIKIKNNDMNKQLIFFLLLAFVFLYGGTMVSNSVLQLSGIVIIFFLIYDVCFNRGNYKTIKEYHKFNFGLVQFLGHIDLIFGFLLFLEAVSGIVPFFLLSFISIIILIKGLVFVLGRDVASFLDIIFSIIIISLKSAPVPQVILIGISIYFIQKGLFSYLN